MTGARAARQARDAEPPEAALRTPADPGPARPAHELLRLQRTVGNRAVAAMLESRATGGIGVSAANDHSEVAADRTAAAALRALDAPTRDRAPMAGATPSARTPASPPAQAPTPPPAQALASAPAHASAAVHRSTDPAGDGIVGPEGGDAGHEVSQALRSRRGAGAPLDGRVRDRFERAFGSDLGPVRIHTGAQADELSRRLAARAFTYGSDIYFGRGQYRPGTADGDRVLAHELAHARQGRARIQRLLWDVPTFYERTGAGSFTGRSRTMSEIARILAEYEALTRHGDPRYGTRMDRALVLLDHLIEDIDLWLDTHKGDTAREKRDAALRDLRALAWNERRKLEAVRLEAAGQGRVAAQRDRPVNKFKESMEGDASSAFMKLAPIVAKAVPTPGDTAEVEVELKVPVGGAKIGFRLGISAFRVIARTAGKADPAKGVKQDYEAVDTTAVTFEAGVSAGFDVLAAELGLAAGCYLEAQGSSPEHAMQLISWGWYQTLYEAGVGRKTLGLLFGGSTGAKGWNRASRWATTVREENFRDFGMPIAQNAAIGSAATGDTYVRGGLFGEVGAEAKFATLAGVGIGTEFGIRLSGGKHWSRETIESHSQDPKQKGRQKLGRKFMMAELAASASAGPFSGELEFWMEFMSDTSTEFKLRPTYLSGWVHASGALPLDSGIADRAAAAAKDFAPKIIEGIRKIALWLDQRAALSGREWVGELAAFGEDLRSGFANIQASTTAEGIGSMQEQMTFSEGETAFILGRPAGVTRTFGEESGGFEPASETGLKLSIGWGVQLDWVNGIPAPVGLNIDVAVHHEKSIELTAGIFSATGSRERRILRVQYEQGRKSGTGRVWWD